MIKIIWLLLISSDHRLQSGNWKKITKYGAKKKKKWKINMFKAEEKPSTDRAECWWVRPVDRVSSPQSSPGSWRMQTGLPCSAQRQLRCYQPSWPTVRQRHTARCSVIGRRWRSTRRVGRTATCSQHHTFSSDLRNDLHTLALMHL